MYAFKNISFSFGDRCLFEDVSFVLDQNDKIALIGKNGAGKTTLFNVIHGELMPDTGKIDLPKSVTIGFLSQHLPGMTGATVLQEVLKAFEDYYTIVTRIEEKNSRLTDQMESDELKVLLEEINTLELRLSSYRLSNPEAEARKVLKGLGFEDNEMDQPLSTLSGGWEMRVQIAKLLLRQHPILLLDEPDNHLDIESLMWFEDYVKSYPGAIIFISHDVQFITNVANRIMEFNHRKLIDFKGTYPAYIKSKEIQREQELAAYTNQQKVIKAKERTITRFMAKASKTRMAQSMQKQLDKMERIEISSDDIHNINFSFKVNNRPGRVITRVVDIQKSFGYKLVLNNVNLTIERGEKVAFIGQNGQGKTTLVKIIAGIIHPSGGKIEPGHNVLMAYYAQDQSERLEPGITVLECLEKNCPADMVPRARSILGTYLFSGDDVDKKVSVLSGGEKARLSLAIMSVKPSNFLIFDEPTNHLDIQSKEILKNALEQYEGTVLLVSHDREIMKGWITKTFEFRNGDVHEHLGDIDYVLEKRALTSMRSYVLDDGGNDMSLPGSQKITEKGYEQRKAMKRRLKAVEKKIQETEKYIDLLHLKMSDPEYYTKGEVKKDAEQLKKLEKDLDDFMVEWDALLSEDPG